MSMTEEALRLLLQQANPTQPIADTDEPVIAVLRDEGGYHVTSLQEYMDVPRRIKQRVILASPQAFIGYVKKFGTADRSVVFVDKQSFQAKLDYHAVPSGGAPPLPSWCEHSALYNPVETNAWKAWKAAHNKGLSQVDFALFVEQRMDDITDPSPGVLMTAVLDFKDTAQHTLVSQQDLSNGATTFQFVKGNITANMTFPKELTIQLPLYEHHALVALKLNVRYRAGGDGSLKMWVAFQRDPVDIIESYFKQNAVRPIREALADFQLYEGVAG